jgi:hypothetical protein
MLLPPCDTAVLRASGQCYQSVQSHQISWHTSLILAGAFELLVMLATIVAFQIPEGDQSLGGIGFDPAALRASLANRDL